MVEVLFACRILPLGYALLPALCQHIEPLSHLLMCPPAGGVLMFKCKLFYTASCLLLVRYSLVIKYSAPIECIYYLFIKSIINNGQSHCCHMDLWIH